LIGSGVTLFNTQDALHAYKPIIFSGGSSTNLSAPTGGTYNGILFFQDPAIGLDTKHNAIQGGGSAIFQGALYFPTTPLEFSGGSSINPENVTLIADTITLSGGSTYIGTGAPVAGQTPPITTSRLYE
jgi:hypothetical protein